MFKALLESEALIKTVGYKKEQISIEYLRALLAGYKGWLDIEERDDGHLLRIVLPRKKEVFMSKIETQKQKQFDITPESQQLHAQHVSDALKVMQDPTTPKPKLDYIALGNSWMKGYIENKYQNKHPQHKDLNKLIVSLTQFCKEQGIEFICGEDSDVASRVKSFKQANKDARGLVLTGEEAINDIDNFLKEIGLKNDKNTILAGVDNKYLTEDSYHRIIQMYEVLIALSKVKSLDEIDEKDIKAWQDELGFRVYQEGRITRIIFVPPAEPKNYETLRDIYKLQIFA